MHILGKLLPDNQPARHALTHFFGIGRYTAHRLCARMQIHDRCKIRDLSAHQVSSLTSFLSSPTTFPPAPRLPLAGPGCKPLGFAAALPPAPAPAKKQQPAAKAPTRDPLLALKIETDLRREVRENIAHQRMIGSYVGRRHAMGLPVRGQNTQTNAKTAKRHNRIDRYL